MSSEKGAGEKLSSGDSSNPSKSSIEERDLKQPKQESIPSERASPPKQKESHVPGEGIGLPSESEKKRRPPKDDLSETIDAESGTGDPPRQVIAVSASKGPAAFFNLARKFLVTDEMCDLSALEGAIVSAVDAAHLLERSQLATIVRVSTSYVTVEPKRKKQQAQQGEQDDEASRQTQPQPSPTTGDSASTFGGDEPPRSQEKNVSEEASRQTEDPQQQQIQTPATPPSSKSSGGRGSSGGRELRRARIVITVQRTESYKRWLEENPLQAIIAGDADDPVLEPIPSDRKRTE